MGQVVLTVQQWRLMPTRSCSGRGERTACATGYVLGFPVCHRVRMPGRRWLPQGCSVPASSCKCPDSGRTRGLWRSPLYYADHHSDLIILVDAYLGMGVVGGAEGAQVRDVLL